MGLLLLVNLIIGCSTERPPRPSQTEAARNDELVRRVDNALAAAARFLASAQSQDGAWRSDVYSAFRDGAELTGHVLSCLYFLPQGGETVRPAFDKGASFMMRLVPSDEASEPGPQGLNFSVFTAAAASRVAVLNKRDEAHRRARDAWLACLRERQHTEANGWQPKDLEYGGWGFSADVPRKPKPRDPPGRFYESNLVATACALAALRAAGVPADEPLYEKVLTFVKRCQNFSDNPAKGDPAYDDGGFFFIPSEPLQNKAGIAGTDKWGRRRFRSYGSMTADGLRALLACGLPADHPRVAAARRWLEVHFAVDHNPGSFPRDREILRNSTYYYYSWALAQAMSALGTKEVLTDKGGVRWAEALAHELLARQKEDGTWRNVYADAKEDDPLVSTPLAASALAICREVISGQRVTIGHTHLVEIPDSKSQIPDSK